MAGELLFEIGTEEIPAGFITDALDSISSIFKKLKEEYRINTGDVRTLGTPRRLTLVALDVADHQKSQSIEKIGPPVAVAIDPDGKPNQKAIGFAKGCGLSVEDLKKVKTEKGEYLLAVITEPERPTKELLPEILERLISQIGFKKSMRWMDLTVRFARPIHWILAIYDGEIIPLKFGNIESGNKTRGHRFMAPEKIEVGDFKDYVSKLKKAYVIVDIDDRKVIVEKEIKKIASSFGGEILPDVGLIDEVVNLTEYPNALGGTFPERYLKLPKDVLVTAMREHQRYFSVVGSGGKLLPNFVTVNNTKPKDAKIVARGNERVLNARLEDARFYFEEDIKVPLKDRLEDLKGVVFHSKLGTSYEKVMRFHELSGWLSDKLAPKEKEKILEAALLAKADLETGIVKEFPSLQGKIGTEYAIREGISEEVAVAINEHYLPVGASDQIPEGICGTVVSLADKMDTICGFFGVGLKPSGVADPYAIRRSTIAIINIITKRGLSLSLEEFIDRSLEILKDKIKRPAGEIKGEVLDFFKGRLSGILIAEGHSQDVVDSVVSVSIDDLVLTKKKVEVLSKWKGRPEFGDLAQSIKRVGNILKGKEAGEVNASLLTEKAEKDLHEAFKSSNNKVSGLVGVGKFDEAIGELLKLKGPIDDFFEGVMVMDKDEKIRENRLALLSGIRALFMNICDFQKIEL